MEDEVESITDVRVRMYREALAEAEEIKLAKEREDEAAKESETELKGNPQAETVKRPDQPGAGRTHSSAQEDSSKA